MSGSLDSLYRLQRRDIRRAASVLADAFEHDPIWSVVLSESTPNQRVSAFETVSLYCERYGKVYASSPNLEGVAAWLPGELSVITPWRLLWSGAIPAALRMGWKAGRKMEPIYAPLDTHRREAMADAPFVYLQIIGVATGLQGQGFGGKILRALIGECERSGVSIYLETETEDNVRMYERFGFAVWRQITPPVIDLPMWLMVRSAGKPAGIQ